MDPMQQMNQAQKSVLFISELPENILESDLETFFHEYKENIIMISVDTNNRGIDLFNTRKPKATIIFKEHQSASNARAALNMKKIKGKTLNIMWHEKDNSVRYNNTANVFVKGIDTRVTPREVYEEFMKYGEILSSKLCEDEDGNLLGYGYVNYYSLDSAEKAIKALNGKEKWGTKLELEHFQKKNERNQNYMGNSNLYVKNFPSTYNDCDIENLFKEFGKIQLAKVETDKMDSKNRKFAIVVFDTAENAAKAKESMNGKNLEGATEPLYVDILMKKSDRKRFLSTKISEYTNKLNQDYKNCNLHVRNIPRDMNEKQLGEIFSEFGEIKSVKINKFILETKVKGELVEKEESSGYGYVCFTTPESATKAIDKLNGKHLPGQDETKTPPLLISVFMPKHERRQMLAKIQSNNPMKYPLMNFPKTAMIPIQPIAYPGRQFRYMPPPQRYQKMNYHHMQNNKRNYGPMPVKQAPQQPPMQPNMMPENQMNNEKVSQDEPDRNYLNSLEGNSEAQKDYLGEFLFKKIQGHPIASQQKFTMETIGKITGMILGIGDIKEIYEITTNNDSLTSRIDEAVGLLAGQNA